MSKTALIIGASRGLGLGLVQELLSRGWEVTATARDLAKSPGLAALKSDALTIETVDIDDKLGEDQFVRRLEGKNFDLIFLVAGIYGPQHQSVDSATPDEVAALFMTNAVAPVRLALRLLGNLKVGSVLAFMTSRLGSIGDNTTGGASLYRASKAALNSMTRSLVPELKDRLVTVLSIHPGWVRTDMGGDDAPLDVATSSAGMIDVIEKRRGSNTHAFVDFSGAELPW